MRHGIFAHAVEINADTVHLLREMKFVFICIDEARAKRLIVERLEEWGIPFIDVGMGVYRADDFLGGNLRATTSLPEAREVARSKISFYDPQVNNEYPLNIQIADLNALNAALAVIKWKKLFGFYLDYAKELHCSYMIELNQLTKLTTTDEAPNVNP